MDYNKKRREAKEIKIGNMAIGGKNKIAIQSMTNTDTADVFATVAQVKALEAKGCHDGDTVSIYDFEFDYVK